MGKKDYANSVAGMRRGDLYVGMNGDAQPFWRNKRDRVMTVAADGSVYELNTIADVLFPAKRIHKNYRPDQY